jgi:hypothetical protein
MRRRPGTTCCSWSCMRPVSCTACLPQCSGTGGRGVNEGHRMQRLAGHFKVMTNPDTPQPSEQHFCWHQECNLSRPACPPCMHLYRVLVENAEKLAVAQSLLAQHLQSVEEAATAGSGTELLIAQVNCCCSQRRHLLHMHVLYQASGPPGSVQLSLL